jgi:hypothetical protein
MGFTADCCCQELVTSIDALSVVSWSSALTFPITLRDGRGLRTLGDAGELISSFDVGRERHSWNQYAAELLMKAAEDDDMIEAATVQVLRALTREGML